MKPTFFLILLFLTSLTLQSQNNIEQEQKLRVKNRINERFTYKVDLTTGDSILTNTDIYDTTGKLIKDLRYNENGIERYSYLIAYNSENLMAKQTGYKFGVISTVLTYKYDKNGNRIEYFQHKPDGTLLNHQRRIYNDKNLNTELYNKSKKSGRFYLRSKYFYNNNDLDKRTERYHENGKLVSTTLFEYVENSTILYANKKKRKNLILKNTYNALNQLIEKHFSNTNKKIRYTYDQEGNKTEEIIYINDTVNSKKIYYYKKFSV